MRLVRLLLILFWEQTAAETSPVLDFLRSKSIRNVNFFNCNFEPTCSGRNLIKNGIYVSLSRRYTIPRNNLKSHRIGMILDARCLDWKNATNFSNVDVFKYPYSWLFLTNDVSSTATVLSDFPIDLDSDVTILYKANNSTFLLYEAYNTGYFVNGWFYIKPIGFWNRLLHISKMPRRNLGGISLKSVVVVTQSIVNETLEHYLQRRKENTFDSLHKLKSFTLLQYFCDMFNFTYELIRSNSWGYLRNGSYDGLVGALQRQEAEIGSTPLFFKKNRSLYIDYVAQTWQSRPCFLFRHPRHSTGYLTIYTRPLNVSVWYSIIALLILSSVFLCMTFKLMTKDKGDCSPSLALLCIWSAFCQQGMTLHSHVTSTKIVAFVSFLCALTLYQYYNALVVSTLLQETPKNIRTLKDLLDSNLKVGIEDVLYDRDYFKRTTDPVAIELYHKKVLNGLNNFHHAAEGLSLVKRGGYAFHVDTSAAYFIIRRTFSEREICDIQEVPLYPPQNMGAVLRKGSPYRELIAYGLRKMFEAGIMHRLKHNWDEPKPRCVKSPGSNNFAVSIREFSMALIVLLCGMLASVLLLIWEISLSKIRKGKNGLSRYHN